MSVLHDFRSPYFLVRFFGGCPLGTVIADLSKYSIVSSSSVSVVNGLPCNVTPRTLRSFKPFVPLAEIGFEEN